MHKPSRMRGLIAAALLAALPLNAAAGPRVYTGIEAQALQCAAYFSYTTLVLERRGLITLRNRQEGAVNATAILGRYVGGTYSQKLKAFQTVLERMPVSETALIQESIRYLSWCSERFLS